MLIAGAMVQIQGLYSTEGEKLNERQGQLLEELVAKGRWRVFIDGDVKQVKIANLRSLAVSSRWDPSMPQSCATIRHFYDAFKGDDLEGHGLERLQNAMGAIGVLGNNLSTCIVWCKGSQDAHVVSSYLGRTLRSSFSALRQVIPCRTDDPPSYVVVSDDHPPAGASTHVLINLCLPTVEQYARRIQCVFDMASPNGIVLNLASSCLVGSQSLLMAPASKLGPRAMPSVFFGHYGSGMPSLPANVFEKPPEILALESVGILFDQLGD